MAVVVEQSFTLVRLRARYTFRVRGDTVEVQYNAPGGWRRAVSVPVREARELYGRLVRQGWERW